MRSALFSNNPVVPVLVGGATLPSEAELPSDLATLTRRQAVELHDETWAQDVEMLTRRLAGKDLVRPSPRWVPVAIGVLSGDRDDMTPGGAASGLIGFNSTRDPTGAALVLETESGVRIHITSGA